MKAVYGRQLNKDEELKVQEIAKSCNILNDTARLLLYRNIDTVEKAKLFLSPESFELYDPFLLKGMNEAVDRISQAKENGESVLIFGDYDADGISASTILYKSLKIFGIDPFVVVPERAEGYGLNIAKVEKFKKENNINLLITVDCGISDREKIEKIKALDIDVIVTDHHEPPKDLPNCITINPKIAGQDYPFNDLCGAGVAYKLSHALIGERANEFLDFAAIATVADSVKLIDENRAIVVKGLKIINSNKCKPIFKYLMGDSDKKVTSQSIAYGYAPRINAGGRMGDAKTSLCAFLETDKDKVFDYAVKLNQYNTQRQSDCSEIYKEAEQIIREQKLYLDNVILVKNEGWTTGFIGLVASKLVEEYNRPAIVFAKEGENLKGSARSVAELNIYDALCAVSKFTLGFGGHSQAAGVTVETDKFDEFSKMLNNYVGSILKDRDSEREIFVDLKVESKVSMRFIKEIELFEPFGVGNKKPLLSVDIESVFSKPIKNGSPHYAFSTDAIDMLDFNGEEHVEKLSFPIKKEIVFEPNYSVFRGNESIKGFVKSIISKEDDYSKIKLNILDNELKKLKTDSKTDYKNIDCSDIEIKKGFGTVYCITDTDNLKKYDTDGIVPSLFANHDKGNSNCIIISAQSIPEGYENVIYLDSTPNILKTDKTVVVSNISGNNIFNKLKTDRKEFEDIFTSLIKRENEIFSDIVSFSNNEDNKEQFIFGFEVFLELGFFETVNGKLYRNKNIKNPLNNSKIYNAISNILGKI